MGVVHDDPTVAQIQDAIMASGSLMGVEFPIVQKENGDWAEYVDEYGFGGAPDDPGIAIIKPTGEFYAVNFNVYPSADGVDWVVKMLDSLLYPREPVNTVLALDRSGSMSGLPPTGATPKIEVLQDAVGTFLDVWETHAGPDDKVGVVDFNGSISQYADPVTMDTLVPLETEAANVESHVSALTATGTTCMGGAVATALDDLDLLSRKHIILFSDGMQNINPMLADVGGAIQILDVDPADAGLYSLVGSVYGDSGVPPKPGEDLDSFDTKIHTIGVGVTASPWTDLMSGIATQTGGLHFETPAPLVDLQSFFVNDLMDSFAGATPQVLRHRQTTFDPKKCGFKDACWINDSARRLTVVLSWEGEPDRSQLVCNLEAPDGTLVDISGRTKVSPRRRVISVPLPPYHRGELLKHDGRWRLHVMGTARKPVPCQVFWIADDHKVHLDLGSFTRVYRVGETLKVNAQLLQLGKPFPADLIQKAKVKVTSPTIDFSRFFEEYKVSPARVRLIKRDLKRWTKVEPSALDIKLHALNTDPRAVARCTRTRSKTVDLRPSSGRLTASVKLEKPGVHPVRLDVEALAGKRGRIVRTRTVNVFVTPRS